MDTTEYIPTPEQFMALMEEYGADLAVSSSHSHKLYYVYPRSESAKFTLDVMGIPSTNGNTRASVEQLVNTCNAWEGTLNQELFEQWRISFNESHVRFIPKL